MDRSLAQSTSRSSSGNPRSSPTSSSSSTPGGSPPFDHTLLNPVVRSKRTPIACTECRRRQVKCTGGTPKCERCEKKGVKCEYIPLHQQRLASAGASSRPQTPSNVYGYPALSTSRSAASSPVSWQQQQIAQSYMGTTLQQGQWSGQYASAGHPSSMPRYSQSTVQSTQASSQAYGDAAYNQAYDVNLSYAQSGHASTTGMGQLTAPMASQYGYASYGAYGHHNPTATATSSGDPRYDYRLTSEQQMALSTSQSGSSYPAQYYQPGQEAYYQGMPQGDPTSGDAQMDWTDPTNAPYPTTYHGQPYP